MLFGWEIGPEVDCWAFGIIVVWMITGNVSYVLRPRVGELISMMCSIRGITALGSSLVLSEIVFSTGSCPSPPWTESTPPSNI
jgi:hypothetical protein